MARHDPDHQPPVDDVEPGEPGVAEADEAPGRGTRTGRRRRGRRREVGPRTAARRAARRRRLRTGLLAVLAAGGLAVAGVALGPTVVDLLDGGDAATRDADAEPAPDTPQEAVAQPTAVLLTTVDPTGDDAGALGATVLGIDPATGRGTILLVPTTLAADVPGFGLLQLARAEEFGGAPLVALTLENLTGLRLDASLTVSQQDWAAVFSRVGGFEVDVRQRLTTTDESGATQVRFEPGPQFLDGPRLAELLTFRQEGEAELAALPRVQQVLEGFLAAAAEDPGIDAVFADGAPMLAASDLAPVERVLRGLVELAQQDAVDVRTLPVTPLGAGDDASYRLDEAGTATLVADRFPRAGDDVGERDGVRLEIRNGNGVPGIGAEVAELLVPLGHRVVLTGNADRFDFATTRVIVYDDDLATVEAAQEILEALGVGRLEVSDVPQGITDVTVLVGQDFVAAG